MSRRTRLIIGGLVAAAAAVFLLSREEPQPRYNGRPLSYWIADYWLGGPDQAAAIQSIGTNAFPFLLRWIRTKEPAYHYSLSGLASRLPRRLRPSWASKDHIPRALLSAHAFQALGTRAGPVVPELTSLAAQPSDPEVADMALSALSYMGTNGAPALLAAAQDPSHPYRRRAIYMVGQSSDLGAYKDIAVTNFLLALKDPAVNQDAGLALGDLKLRPDIVVPALAECLQNSNTLPNFRAIAAISLIWFDEKSAPALPYLTNALNDPDPEVRRQAANSIRQINGSILRAQFK